MRYVRTRHVQTAVRTDSGQSAPNEAAASRAVARPMASSLSGNDHHGSRVWATDASTTEGSRMLRRLVELPTTSGTAWYLVSHAEQLVGGLPASVHEGDRDALATQPLQVTSQHGDLIRASGIPVHWDPQCRGPGRRDVENRADE